MGKKGINRRKLLGTACVMAAADPIQYMASLFLQKKYGIAQANAATDKRYILITQPGAPARWMFDLLLNPGGQNNFSPSPHMATRYTRTANISTGTEYHLIDVNGNMVPPLWNVDLPAPGSGTRKLSSLLSNMTHMRGINTANAAHVFCQRIHMQPLGATTTVTALTAGGGGTPIPAVDIRTGTYTYADAAGLLPVALTGNGNIIAEMMESFSNPVEGSSFANKEAMIAAEINAAQDALNSALVDKPGVGTVKTSSDSAQMVMQRNFPNFDTEWNRLLAKYRNLMSRALRNTRYPGVNDRPIGVSGTRNSSYNHNGRRETKADLRDLIGSNTEVRNLAQRFAALEFIITHDLSRSVSLSIGGLIRLSSSIQSTQVVDEHQTGAMVSLFLDTLLYGAVGACLLELVEVLKGLGIYNDTVIDLSGEFNRMPRMDRSGSDHGFQGASVALFTGQVTNGPFIIGNIRTDTNNRYRGTWGMGAGNGGVGRLSVGHFAATLATLLEAPSPVSAASSLVERRPNGTIRSKLAKGRIV